LNNNSNFAFSYYESSSRVRVFAFGVGNGVDRDLVDRSAQSGNGKSYFVTDSNKGQLKSQVIDALQCSAEPYLEDCKFKMTSGDGVVLNERALGNLSRNQMVQFFFLIKNEDFEHENFHCQFTCEIDPRTDKSNSIEFSKDSFISLDK